MNGPRSARIDELHLVENLANEVFRNEADQENTMFLEYPDLFNAGNIENIRIIEEDGIPVANINYLLHTIRVYGCELKAASVGGVATLEGYRGRGYSTLLLQDSIERMKSQKVHLLLISGDRSMYRAAGSLPAGMIYEYNLKFPTDFDYPHISIREFSDECLDTMMKIYMNEAVRYIRSFDKYKLLLYSKKFIYSNKVTRVCALIGDEHGTEAYVIMAIKREKAKIVDSAGSNVHILKSLPSLLKKFNLNEISGYVKSTDNSGISFCKQNNIELSPNRLDGTIKIIDFEGMMESLRPYFYEAYSNTFVKGIEFKSTEAGMYFIREDGFCILSERSELNDLIFGGGNFPENSLKGYNAHIFYDFFKKVFPIPFVNTCSLDSV